MKRLFFTSLCLALVNIVNAQLSGDGYYRIQNAATGRYISLVNNKVDSQNKDMWQVANTGAHIYALKTTKPFSQVVSDPGSIFYIAQGTDGYILRGQGMDTKDLTGRYLKIYNSRNTSNAYWLYATESGTAVYLKDRDDALDNSKNTGYVLASTSRSEAEIDWNLIPINPTDQYIGITPEFSIGDKHYATIYAGFPFAISDGMKAYYVKNISISKAELAEITETEIPAGTPVILECSSTNPADNRLTLLTNQPQVIQDNILQGLYFSYVKMSMSGGEATTDLARQLRNVTPYDAETMRVLGEVDGKLSFVTASDLTYLPANKAYLTVSSTADDNIQLVSADDFAASLTSIDDTLQLSRGVFTLTGVRLRSDSSIEGLPNGMYIINGKKVLVK